MWKVHIAPSKWQKCKKPNNHACPFAFKNTPNCEYKGECTEAEKKMFMLI